MNILFISEKFVGISKAPICFFEGATVTSGMYAYLRKGGKESEVLQHDCGTMSTARIALIEVAEAYYRTSIRYLKTGDEIVLGSTHYRVVRSSLGIMVLRLYEHWLKSSRVAVEDTITLVSLRRKCFALKDTQIPKRVSFAKGTVSVATPPGAVARLGSSESSMVIFLDKFVSPLAAYKAAGSWDNHYAEEIPIPDWVWRSGKGSHYFSNYMFQRFSSLGKSPKDIIFGTGN